MASLDLTPLATDQQYALPDARLQLVRPRAKRINKIEMVRGEYKTVQRGSNTNIPNTRPRS